ncbi:MAG: DUF4340 domain-containing protein [Kiritimatiellales bacterium]|nr:DUF4340 domain-containing protein [Kiritimatiellales bacterium]
MKGRTTLILFVCVVLAGLFIWAMEVYRKRATHQFVEQIQLFKIDPENLLALRFEYSNTVVECTNENGVWMTGGANAGRADVGLLNRGVAALNSLGKGTVITADELQARGVDPSEFGFDTPHVRITAIDTSGRRVWLVGRRAALGKMVYVKQGDADEIYTVTDRLLKMLPRDVSELRDRVLFAGEPASIRRVEIRGSGGFVEIVKDQKSGWRIQQPVSAHADQTKMATFLDSMYRFRVEKFIADNVSDFAVYGLQGETRQVSLGAADGTARTVVIGDGIPEDAGYVYARRTDEASVYGFNKDILDLLEFELDDFRDRRVLAVPVGDIASVTISHGTERLEMVRGDGGDWQVTKPVRWIACKDEIDRLLKTWDDAYIVDFNDAAGELADEPAEPVWTVSFGAGDSGQTNVIYVMSGSGPGGELKIRRNDEQADHLINLREIPGELADPLHYKDPLVLQVSRNDIQKISLETDRGTEVVSQQPDGSFEAVATNADVQVSAPAVEALADALGHVMAKRYVAYNPGDLAFYGMVSPVATLHIGLAGNNQIGHVLVIGKETEQGNYAMVQGRDVVFVLDRLDVRRLTGNMVVSSGGDAETRK